MRKLPKNNQYRMVNEDKNKEVEGKRMAIVLVNTATPAQIWMKSID